MIQWKSDETSPCERIYRWPHPGVLACDGVRFQPFPVMVTGAPPGEIKTLVADRHGRLWVAKDRGVVICLDQGRATTVVGPEHAAADIGASLMVEDAAGAV